MTTKAIFHGSLAKKFGREHEFDAPTVFLMMRGLSLQLGDKFAECVKAGKWHIVLGESKNASYLKDASNAIEPEQVHQQLGKTREVHFYPYIEGKSAVARIVIGAVLVVVGLYTGNVYLTAIGAQLIVGGVTQMMASKPSSGALGDSTATPSYFFNNKQNVTQQGVAVPLVYGRVKHAGSVVISQGSSAAKIVADPFVLAGSLGIAATYSQMSMYQLSNVGVINVLSNGYWAIGDGSTAIQSGKWATNPADGGGGAYEVMFTATANGYTGSGAAPSFQGAGSWRPLNTDQQLVIDGTGQSSSDSSTTTVTVTIRKIGTTTPTLTATTNLTLVYDYTGGV